MFTTTLKTEHNRLLVYLNKVFQLLFVWYPKLHVQSSTSMLIKCVKLRARLYSKFQCHWYFKYIVKAQKSYLSF